MIDTDPIMGDGIVLDNALSAKHLICLLYLRLVLKNFAPVVHELNAAIFHPLCHCATQELNTTAQQTMSSAELQNILSIIRLSTAKRPNHKLRSSLKCYLNIYFLTK